MGTYKVSIEYDAMTINTYLTNELEMSDEDFQTVVAAVSEKVKTKTISYWISKHFCVKWKNLDSIRLKQKMQRYVVSMTAFVSEWRNKYE
jgi:ribosomal protein L23